MSWTEAAPWADVCWEDRSEKLWGGSGLGYVLLLVLLLGWELTPSAAHTGDCSLYKPFNQQL